MTDAPRTGFAASPPDALTAGSTESVVLIRVKGHGSFRISQTMKEYCVWMLGEGCSQFIFDMKACDGMDSTFMGVVAGIARHLPKESVVMINLDNRPAQSVRTLGLDRLILCNPNGSVLEVLKQKMGTITNMANLVAENGDKRTVARTLLEAHEVLAAVASSDKRSEFKDAIECLKKEVEKLDGSAK